MKNVDYVIGLPAPRGGEAVALTTSVFDEDLQRMRVSVNLWHNVINVTGTKSNIRSESR